MKCEGMNVSFVGPNACGKTTTLIRAYHQAKTKEMSTAFIDLDPVIIPNVELALMSRKVYSFIDNAQMFNERSDSDIHHLKGLVAKCSMAMCVAFSPMIVEKRDYQWSTFPLQLTTQCISHPSLNKS